jgi:hypothetical protein
LPIAPASILVNLRTRSDRLWAWLFYGVTEWIHLPRRALQRWHAWKVHEFVDTRFLIIAHGQFMPPDEAAALPASLLVRFDSSDLASPLIATLWGTVRRYMAWPGLLKQRRVEASRHFAPCEVRSFEVEHVNSCWHLDFHTGSRMC